MDDVVKQRILIIDDDEDLQKVFASVFSVSSYEYTGALDAASGMAVIDSAETPFDLIVVDGLLPDRSGIALCGDIRADSRCSNAKIIFMTGHFRQAAVFSKLIVDFKVDLVLQKPVDPNDLVSYAGRLISNDTSDACSLDPDADLFESLRCEYIESFHANIAKIEALLRGAAPGMPGRDLTGLLFIVHKMHGSAGIFGFGDVSSTAGEWEIALHSIIDKGNDVSEEDIWAFERFYKKIKLDFQLQLSGAGPDDDAKDERLQAVAKPLPLLLIVDSDEQVHEALSKRADAEGFRIASCRIPGEALKVFEDETPAAVFMEVDYNVYMDGYALARKLREKPSLNNLPIAFTTLKKGLLDRVEAVRAGASVFIEKPAGPDVYFNAARSLLRTASKENGVVAFVDSDYGFLSRMESVFRNKGYGFEAIDTPHVLWDMFENDPPDAVLMNTVLPFFSGLDICRAIRADKRWNDMPIIMLTETNDADTVKKILAAGADDFVICPVSGDVLVSRLEARLDRVRLFRRLAEKDPLTGLLNRKYFLEKIRKDICSGVCIGMEALSVGVVAVDDMEDINARYGFDAGDAVLCCLGERVFGAFGGMALIARWTGHQFIVMQSGAAKQELVDHIAGVLDDFRNVEFTAGDGVSFNAVFSSGVAEFPADGGDVDAVIHAAEDALRRASGGGGAMVASAKRGICDDSCIDVLIVDDDEAICRIMGFALKTRGYTYEIKNNGQDAKARLLSDAAGPSPRIVLMDVNLPGIDGFSLLKQIRESEKGRDIKIIMLTAHGREEDFLRGFECGADDFVAKPFSVPVLIHRIRLAMM